MKTGKVKAIDYLKGLGLTYLALLIFSALGWVRIADPFTMSHLVVPFLMAAVIWTAMYFLSSVAWTILLALASCTAGIGILIGLGILGYIALRLAAFVLPLEWVTFTDDPLWLLVMGGTIALIDLIVDEEKRDHVTSASDDEDETTE